MARKTQIIFTDDVDGSDASGTVGFSLDGINYEIDLNDKHAEQLRGALAKYVNAGRKTGSVTRRPGRAGARTTRREGPNPSQVRDWAKGQGIELSSRGRVPHHVVLQFQQTTEA
jgi:hypothetical protein